MYVKPVFLILETWVSPQCWGSLAPMDIVLVFYCCCDKLHNLCGLKQHKSRFWQAFVPFWNLQGRIHLPAFSSIQRLPVFLDSWPLSLLKARSSGLNLSCILSLWHWLSCVPLPHVRMLKHRAHQLIQSELLNLTLVYQQPYSHLLPLFSFAM